MSGLYLYCVLKARMTEGPLGIGGVGEPPSEVFVFNEGRVAAAASACPSAESLDLVRDSRAHHRVLERLLEDGSLLPASFGTVADEERRLRLLLRRREAQFLQMLDDLEGKVEVGVKAFWEKAWVVAEVESRYGAMNDLKKKAGGDPSLGVEVGKAVAEIIERWKGAHMAGVKELLEREALGSRYNEPISVRMLLNASYLVRREDLPRFEGAILELDRRYGSKIRFHMVSPLPPYNFVKLEISREEVGACAG